MAKPTKAYLENTNPEMDITSTIEELRKGNTPAQFKKMNIHEGRVLTFNYEGSITSLHIGRIEKGHYYAKEITLHEKGNVVSHYGHLVDATQSPPFCTECSTPVSEPATLDGKRKFEARKERHLSDGTPIEEPLDDEFDISDIE